MEGGQKSEISLESGLDVKSSDQLVPVDKPLFQHNRQRFQGSMLPTSLRYEHNGWACGWDVYEFEVDTIAVDTDPAGYTVIRQKFNDNPAYIFRIRSGTTVFAQIWYNAADSSGTEGLAISHDADNYAVVTLSGDNNGHGYSITVNVVTGEISCDGSGWIVAEGTYEEAVGSGGVAALNLTDLESWVQFNAAIVEAEDVKYGDAAVAPYYSCEGTSHVWKDTSGSGWEISYDSESGECLVNGESAGASRDGSALSIAYDTSYSGTAEVSAQCEEFFFQLGNIYLKQNTTYVSTSNVSAEDFGKWSLYLSGDSYICPTDSDSPKAVISCSIPFWCGISLKYTVVSSLSPALLSSVGADPDYPASDSYGIISGTIYLLSSDGLFIYEDDIRGASGQFWLGAEECLSAYGTLDTTDAEEYDDLVASFTLCACVFNRIALAEDADSEYGIPVRAGLYGDGTTETSEGAPWLDAFEAENAEGNVAQFAAGFYHAVAYHDGGELDGTPYGAGWYLSDGEGIARPDLYPDAYPEDEVAASVAVGDEEYGSVARLDAPYAFYDIKVLGEAWPGTRYEGYADDSASAARSSVDVTLQLRMTEYRDSATQKTYSLGEAGYLLPYFIDSSDSSADTRDFEGYVGGTSGSTSGNAVMSFSSGPLAGWEVDMYVSKTAGGSLSHKSNYVYLKSSYAERAAKSWIESAKTSLKGSGYSTFTSSYSCSKNSKGRYRYSATVKGYSTPASVSLRKNGSTVWSVSTDTEERFDSLLEYFDIAPMYACAIVSGGGTATAATGQCGFMLSLCYEGKLQSDLGMSNDSGDGVFTSSSMLGQIALSPSSSVNLLSRSGFFLDRDAQTLSGSESGGDLSCTMFGVNVLQVSKYSVSVSSGTATLNLYVKPSGSSGFYVYSGSDSDMYVPGTVYYGSSTLAVRGYNLSGETLPSSYGSSPFVFCVKGDAVAFHRMLSSSVLWQADSGTHDFYTKCLPLAVSAFSAGSPFFGSATGQSNGYAQATQTVSLGFGNGAGAASLQAKYVLSDGSASTEVSLVGGAALLEYGGYAFSVDVSSYSWSLSYSAFLSVSVPLHYALEAGLPCQRNYASSFCYDAKSGKYSVDGEEYGSFPAGSLAVGYDNSDQTYSFESDGGYAYKYSASEKELVYGTERYETEAAGDARKAEVESFEALGLSFVIEGPYKSSDSVEVVSFDGETVSFIYGGQEYKFGLSALMTDDAPGRMAFMYTDTQDPSAIPESVTFAVQNTESEYQFLRQQWNTLVEVENYWWIDENTILELNKTSLAVKRKVSSFSGYDKESDVDIDDWGGDAWETACSFDRGDYIDNTVARYGVTCAYGGAAPRFWTVQVASGMSLKINFYALAGSDRSFSFSKQSVEVPVNVVSIGSELNAVEGSLNTYSSLSAEAIAYEATYSGTVIGEHVLFGIHLDNNFSQWALDIEGGSLNNVVQGYGYVGLDGCLTGGEIPSAHFDPAVGFSGTVLPIDEIEQEDMEYVSSLKEFTSLEAKGKVIGDESQQWYISEALSGIVSHLTWNGDSWDAVSIPLSNTYSCVYGSPSYGRRVISDYSFWGQNLSSLLPDDSLSSVASTLMDILTTKIYGYSPKVTYSLYLQQTMGQYAYVHYNSATPGKRKDLTRENDSENPFSDFGYQGNTYTALNLQQQQRPEPIDAITAENSDDFSFNLHGARQSITVEKPWSGSFGIMPLVMSVLSTALTTAGEALSVNLRSNQVSANDVGRRFSQIFLYNMDNLATLDKTITGTIPTLQSAVGSACTLDMFYSTCDGQEISAGPGWVQHNMVAQCVAQSVTSCQWELQQTGMLWIVEGLGSLPARVLANAAKAVWDAVLGEGDSLKETWTLAVGSGTNPGAISSAITVGIAGAVYIAAMTYLSVAEITEIITRSICGGTSRVEALNAASKHTYDVEGKHKYGQKSEVFMWPCFGIVNDNAYTDETVEGVLTEHEWKMHVPLTSGISFLGASTEALGNIVLEGIVPNVQDDTVVTQFNGDIMYLIANAKGSTTEKTLPSKMAVITGADSFLPPVPFRNENIGVSEPVFPTPCFQDYIIDEDWELSRTASASSTQWISCKDTKLIDGDMSNAVVSDDFCGVACPYAAIEVKRGCEQKYVRPWAITPNALALNQTGYNCCYERKAYHAFDGYGQRYVRWCGARGMNKEGRIWHYAFIVNDRFKRSNKLPVDEFIGNFRDDPIISMKTTGEDWVFNHCTDFTDGNERGYEVGVIGEDKDARRYAAPVFTEFVSSLPATLKTTSSFGLSVIDGITSLTSDNTDKQHAYKAPVSVDFSVGKDKYRFTDEYISKLEVDPRYGVTTVEEAVPTLGLSFLGSTPYEAYLYSEATRQYYTYAGGGSLNGIDTLERFRNVEGGVYDFVQQEVAVPCVATFERLDRHVHDDWDERDNRMVPRLKDGHFIGEVWPPIEPIYNNRSGFRLVSLPSGLCYQGPNRCIINRFVYNWYMKEQIIENYGKWKKVPRERYHPFRIYEAEYERVDENVASTIIGWTHNPFLLVTSPLGISSETDCLYEWEITFAWPVEMDELYGDKQYACVNVLGECFAPGGKAIPDRPAHVFLWRDLFTRTGNYGYYSFRYQSRCGAGNRERLHVWSDQYIAVSGLQVEVKPVTEKRTEILTQQVDVQDMEEV